VPATFHDVGFVVASIAQLPAAWVDTKQKLLVEYLER
jgi:hypothetical protein